MRCLLVLALVLFVCESANADNYLINSGTSTFTGDPNVSSVQFSTAQVTGSFGGHGFGNRPCTPCNSGQTINLNASSGSLGSTDMSGDFTIDGVQYNIVGQIAIPPLPLVNMTGSFGFTTGNVSIPLSNDPTLTLSAPFTVGGGFNTINGAFSFTFSGTGT